MKVRSLMVDDENVKDLFKDVLSNDNVSKLLDFVVKKCGGDASVYRVNSVRITKSGNVFVEFDDFTEEKNELSRIIAEAVQIKSELVAEQSKDNPDIVKISVLQAKLGELSSKYDKIKGDLGITNSLYDVI